MPPNSAPSWRRLHETVGTLPSSSYVFHSRSHAAWIAGGLIASAVLLFAYGRAEAPWHLTGFVAVAPFLVALERLRTMKGALWAGLAMSVASSTLWFGWFPLAVHRYTGLSMFLTWPLFVLASPLLQPQWLVFAGARHTLLQARAGRTLAALGAAGLYLLTEWLHPKLFSDTLGHGLHPASWLRQVAELGGAGTLTFLLLLCNEAVVAVARSRRRVGDVLFAIATSVLLVAAVGWGGYRSWQLGKQQQTAQTLKVGYVQANITDYAGLAQRLGTYDAVQHILITHSTLSQELVDRGAKLLVWPETVYPTTFGSPRSEEGAEVDQQIRRFVDGAGVPLLFGAYDHDGKGEYNAAFLLAPGATSVPAYHKVRPFPLSEHVPAWLDSPRFRAWFGWAGNWKAGGGPMRMALPGTGVTLSPLLCFDAVDPLGVAEAAKGAQLLVTLSNDAWFGGTTGPRQHLLQVAFRSIENRIPQLRVTNSGISALIDATGELHAITADGQRGAMLVDVPLTR